MKNNIFILIVFCSIFDSIITRYVSSSVNAGMLKRDKGWVFLDRMAFDEGDVSFKLTMKINSPRESSKSSFKTILHIIPDFAWQQQIVFKCDRQPETTALKIIQEKGASISPSSMKTLEVPLNFNRGQGFSLLAQSSFSIDSPVTYNFVFKDCQKSLINQPWRRQSRLEFTIQLKNGQLDHGSDQKFNSIFLPILITITAVMIYFSRKPTKQSFVGQKDWGQILVFTTLIFNLIGIIFYWMGHIIYTSVNGKFYGFFDFMYLLFHSVSQSILTGLILLVAFGWTITFLNDAEFDLYVPLIAMLGIINLILTLLGKINDGSAQKYHMYDTIPSYILIFFRLVSVSIMLFGIIKEYRDAKKNQKLRNFYLRFGILGSIYFLSLPGIMLIANIFEYEERKVFVFISVQIFKNGVNALMTWMVSSRKSKYSDAKFTNRSFMESQNKLL